MRGNGFKHHDLDKLEKWSEKTRLQFNKPENKHCAYMKRRTEHKIGKRQIEFPQERIEAYYKYNHMDQGQQSNSVCF